MEQPSKRKLKANTELVTSLTRETITELYNLYSLYYENVQLDQFTSDLLKKMKIIIMRNPKKEICGFSTITFFSLDDHPEKPYCIYSGDTIIHQDYWGTSALTIEFLKNIMLAKLQNPFKPVWWFLISKGYKTYLLLANNFHEYYPRVNVNTPSDKLNIIESLSEKIYPNCFSRETGIISFDDDNHERLKQFVAPITDQITAKNKKIKFFQDSNPNWEKGDELACIGKVSLALGFTHPYKVIMKPLKKKYRVTLDKLLKINL
ncbi:hypothetical protein A9Q84_19660 [Halobacteriovorax marinus]|uniref:Uncharacterized protein n=1 Tax=Halobacteriovorax marinus TaxID=97084 RepID=A0A1Y5F2Z7_9BACT|nr:hypothetical protein A9Q84_19660 [Halobacteriovorax marinus]